MSFSITIIIVIITTVVSIIAFRDQNVMNKLIFYPPSISRDKEWYRFFSNGLIHADIGHLAFNMIALYSFGDLIEGAFADVFGAEGSLLYIIMYVSSLAVCIIPTYVKNKDNYYYRSLGASGAVSAVMFAAILYAPTLRIGFFFIPLPIPAVIFGPLFLIITAYLDKRGGGGINHSAHLWGALYGIVFFAVMSFALHTGFNPLMNFVNAVRGFLYNG
jgi:membrane associated rhomboid family serine protease